MTGEPPQPRGSSEEYRKREAEMRQAAEAAELPGVRAKFLEAAERWRHLAELAESPSAALRWNLAPPWL